MTNQNIFFSVTPRAMAVDSATLPVSVFVSPRLSGADRLDAFPDWLDWTALIARHGLRLTLQCGANSQAFEVNTAPLRPDLWRALFRKDTFVRSYQHDDYTDRSVMSYSARAALSVLKATYQDAGIALALPDRPGVGDAREGQHGERRRSILRSLLDGLAVDWSEDSGERLRKILRASAGAGGRAAAGTLSFPESSLGADGTFAVPAPGSAANAVAVRRALAGQFGVYSHMPQGTALVDRPQDLATVIDIHQALSSLNSYPELLRALGIVFDLELPIDFVATTPVNGFGTLAVIDVPGRQWTITTTTVPNSPPVATAYLHWHAANPPFRLFTAAPATMEGSGAPLDVFGLLMLDPQRHGVAQVDLESGMHKVTLLAESWSAGRPGPAPADRPDVFDETTTLPSLRSGGFSLYADGRAHRLVTSFARQKQINADLSSAAPTGRALFAEDLMQGWRMDVWDSATGRWHSLHQRQARFDVNGVAFAPDGTTEGFAQLAAAQPSPGAPASAAKDLYLNESMARWVGWSLSVPFPGKALSHETDPAKALDPSALASQNAPGTPFKVGTTFKPAAGTLPVLRFGRRYRFRLRAVDLAGNSMRVDDPIANLLATSGGLPRDAEGMAYLRFEPVDAPVVVLRDAASVCGPGSQLDRLVMRTFNASLAEDTKTAVGDASDRFIVPPSTSVEMAERLGMFDVAGKPDTSAAMYALIAARDKGRLPQVNLEVGGKAQDFPLVAAADLEVLPYLPDALSRGAAFRDLPGGRAFSVGHVAPGLGPDAAIGYEHLGTANPRPGSATLVSFADGDDWQDLKAFRLALGEGDAPPHWDPAGRVLTVSLPKAEMALVSMTSYLNVDDLKLMGVWQWLREAIDRYSISNREIPIADARFDSDIVAHILQRAQEGGHWMLTPPRMLTLVHAVQQPIGAPRFTALTAQHEPYGTAPWASGPLDDRVDPNPAVLQTAPESTPTTALEIAAITAWRRPNSTDVFVLGALEMHAASTDRIEMLAAWSDPVDDPTQARKAGDHPISSFAVNADDIPVPSIRDGYFYTAVGTPQMRAVAYHDADHGLLCFARAGDRLGSVASGVVVSKDAAPRHRIGDTRRHRIRYTARATSRFREYFDAAAGLDFTRTSESVLVDVPASARPVPPQVSHVVPTFAWQRQTDSNIKRSVRFGGGLRIFLDRPWFSSGEGELLGMALYNYNNGAVDPVARERWKAHVTQWGADPIWTAGRLDGVPTLFNVLNSFAQESSVSLPSPSPGRVDVAGYEVAFDEEQQKWFADLALDTQSLAYMPFVRLVLVRYQPVALPDAKLSAPVVADFAQLTPERMAVVTADPYHPRTLRVTVSGPGPTGPAPEVPAHSVAAPRPMLLTVTVQEFDPSIGTDLAWSDAPALATVAVSGPAPDDTLRWTGNVTFAQVPEPGHCRLLIREYELLSANWTEDSISSAGRRVRQAPRRLIYAETLMIDSALIGPPSPGVFTRVDL